MGCSHKVAERLQDGSNDYGGSDLFPFYDGLGSTTDLVDGSANVIGTYRYDVFGAIRSQTGSSPNQWLFTGEQRDGDSDMYYLRARYYDPPTGRFLSQDPAHAGHPYVYAANNPVLLIDPYGLDACDTVAGMIGADDECRWVADQAESGLEAAGDGLEKVNQEVIQPVENFVEDHGFEALKQCVIWGAGGALGFGAWGAVGGCAAGAGGVVAEALLGPNPYSECAAWGAAGIISRGGLRGALIGCATGVVSYYLPDSPEAQCLVWAAGGVTTAWATGNPGRAQRAGVAGCYSGALSLSEL